jgi:hypothetical protein
MPRPPPPSWLEKFIDRQKAERRVEGEETNGVRRFSEASGRRRRRRRRRASLQMFRGEEEEELILCAFRRLLRGCYR